jgi:Glycosyltransferase family 87
VAACAVPDGGLFRAARFRDVHLYHGFAQAVLDGRVPYRDFFMEYPPGALAVFLPADAFGAGHYNAAFKSLMALCGAATIVVVALLLVHLGATRTRLWAAVALLALSPIALGPISLNTYDAWPALLTVAALALLIGASPVAAFAVLGLAFAAKVYPVVLLPPALVFVWRRAGQRVAMRALVVFALVAAVVVVPFLALAPHGLAESFRWRAWAAPCSASRTGSAGTARPSCIAPGMRSRTTWSAHFPVRSPLPARSRRSPRSCSLPGSTSAAATGRSGSSPRSRPAWRASSPSRVSSRPSILSG